MKKKLIVVGMLAVITGVAAAVCKKLKKYSKVKNSLLGGIAG